MIKIGIELMRTILKHNPPLIIKKIIGKKGSRKRAGLCPLFLIIFLQRLCYVTFQGYLSAKNRQSNSFHSSCFSNLFPNTEESGKYELARPCSEQFRSERNKINFSALPNSKRKNIFLVQNRTSAPAPHCKYEIYVTCGTSRLMFFQSSMQNQV